MSDPLYREPIWARVNAATKGPWCYVQDDHHTDGRVLRLGSEGENRDICRLSVDRGVGDAEFIAHSRQDVADLLKETDRLIGILREHGIRDDGWPVRHHQ